MWFGLNSQIVSVPLIQEIYKHEYINWFWIADLDWVRLVEFPIKIPIAFGQYRQMIRQFTCYLNKKCTIYILNSIHMKDTTTVKHV